MEFQNALLHSIIHFGPIGVLIVNREGKILFSNPKADRLFDYTAEEMLNLTMVDLIPERFRENHAALHTQFLNSPKYKNMSFGREVLALKKSGEEIGLEIGLSPYTENDQDYTICYIQESSYQLIVDKELTDSEKFLEQIAQSVPNIIYLYDLKERKNVYVNREIAHTLGYDSDDIRKMGSNVIATLVHPEDLPKVIDTMQQLLTLQKGHTIDIQYRMRHKKGYYVDLLDRVTPFSKNEEGETIQTLGIVQDISERVIYEKKILYEEEKFRIFFENSLDPLLLFKKKEGIIDCSLSTIAILGANSKAEIIGKMPSDFSPEFQEPGVRSQDKAMLIARFLSTNQSSYRFEWVQKKMNGDLFTVITRINRLTIQDEEVFLISWNDISDQKQYEQELMDAKLIAEAASGAKSEFLATISHEIRTPMNGVIGMTSLLESSSLNKEQKEMVQVIKSSGESLLNLINEILDFSKIEAGQVELESREFNLRILLGELENAFKPIAKGKSLTLNFVVNPEIPERLMGDPNRLSQVLKNLLSNALKFTSVGSISLNVEFQKRKLESETQDWEIIFRVKDTGIGISESKKNSIFKPFYQADSSITRTYGGTGLGLAISKRLVELMKGIIGFESKESQGSHFYFLVPFQVVPSVVNTNSLKAKEELGFTFIPEIVNNILLVEDNTINQLVAKKIFQKIGYEIDIADNGAIALEMLTSKPYLLIFMDIQMPVLDGIETTRQIRLNSKIDQPYIIAVTANAMKGDKEKYLETGMDSYLSKPFTLSDIQRELSLWKQKL